MENELNQVHKTMRLYQTFFSTGSFSQAAPLRWENQHKKKQQSHVQTIQRTATSRNV